MDVGVRDPVVGRVLDARYHVLSRLARGGMATVYEAVDVRLDRVVAVKVMHPGLAEDEEFVARFIREAKSAARLSHPNVVSVFDQGRDGDAVFLAMELVEGRTLRDLLRERGRLPPVEALRLMEPVLAALGAAHRAGIVHRDVKPENVLLAADGRVKVADFGLARAVTGSTSTATAAGLLMGTVSYLAPEQVERGIADARSDVYAAGIVLYELLTGEKPHTGTSPIQVAYQHVHVDVPPPSSRAPGLPASIDALVRRATSRNADGRPADAGVLLLETTRLRRALEAGSPPGYDEPTSVIASAENTGAIEHTDRLRGDVGLPPPVRRRRRRRGVLILLLVLLLAASAALAPWLWRTARYTSAPDVVGRSVADARTALSAHGLGVGRRILRFDERVPAGRVISTDPAAGDDVERNGSVALVVSRGPEVHPVPQLTGRTVTKARELLAAQHLQLGERAHAYDNEVPHAHIVSQARDPGTKLRPGSRVDVVVSRGPAPVDVPDVTGSSADDATSTLEDAAFSVARTDAFSDSVDKGAVISQSPSSGTAERGSTVTIVVSKGPELFAVPDVTGKNVTDARTALEKAGFAVRELRPLGGDRVVRQSPGGGSLRARGSTITLLII